MINAANNSNEVVKRETVVQVLEQLLPRLPYSGLGPLLWSLREYVGEVQTVAWIREYCKVSLVCHENLDVHRADPLEASDIEAGDVIVLVGQDIPRENGVYVYTGIGCPLLKDN